MRRGMMITMMTIATPSIPSFLLDHIHQHTHQLGSFASCPHLWLQTERTCTCLPPFFTHGACVNPWSTFWKSEMPCISFHQLLKQVTHPQVDFKENISECACDSFKCQLTTTYRCLGRVVIGNCLGRVGQWPCMWGLSTDVGGPNPFWVAPFHGLSPELSKHKVSRIQANK